MPPPDDLDAFAVEISAEHRVPSDPLLLIEHVIPVLKPGAFEKFEEGEEEVMGDHVLFARRAPQSRSAWTAPSPQLVTPSRGIDGCNRRRP